jgi:hypothetical protein
VLLFVLAQLNVRIHTKALFNHLFKNEFFTISKDDERIKDKDGYDSIGKFA